MEESTRSAMRISLKTLGRHLKLKEEYKTLQFPFRACFAIQSANLLAFLSFQLIDHPFSTRVDRAYIIASLVNQPRGSLDELISFTTT